jgi:transcription elongation factor Elf1
MWAASQWATATQKYSRDRVCTAATKADACHQRYASEESDQAHDHGEVVVRSAAGAPTTFECVECGSSFGIDQDCTLTEHRTAQTAADGVCAADGGAVVEEASETADGLSDGLRSRWRDARAAAVVEGAVVERECDHEEPDTCPLCATETEAPHHTVSGEVPIPESAAPSEPVEEESASFRRPPTWEPVAVVRAWSEESESVGAPSGVEYAEVIVEGAGAAVRKVPERLRPLPPPSWLEGPEPWERHPVEESDVRGGLLPPPEIVAKEEAERCRRDRVTPKEWPDDWYARRFGASAEDVPDGDRRGLDGGTCWRVVQIVRSEPSVSAVAVAGRLQLSPSVIGDVRELMETAKRR